jgi:hypothetical protein
MDPLTSPSILTTEETESSALAFE